jgi:ribose 5-phosphate isomerase B
LRDRGTTRVTASDHAGFEYKAVLKSPLESKGITVEDFGTDSADPVDYPDMMKRNGK